MKTFKRIALALLGLLVLLAAIFFTGRYGWKALGFRACQEAGIESVSVRNHAVEIKGFYPGSFPEGCCGYYAEEKGDKLYVGFRFSAIFGFFEPGTFDETIPVNGEIHEVLLKTNAAERSLWTAESSAAATAEDCSVYVRLERGMLAWFA